MISRRYNSVVGYSALEDTISRRYNNVVGHSALEDAISRRCNNVRFKSLEAAMPELDSQFSLIVPETDTHTQTYAKNWITSIFYTVKIFWA